jgi:peroxiredoxin
MRKPIFHRPRNRAAHGGEWLLSVNGEPPLRKAIAAILFTFGFIALAGYALANPDFDLGPAVGAQAPSIGTPPDSTGKPRALTSLTGEKGVVLVFFRSAAWCPYCQAQLIALNDGRTDIEKRGYRLAAISYDQPEVLAGFVARRGIAYPLLSDPKSEIIDRYGLRDPQYPPGSRAHGVPRPIIFVIGRTGTIEAKLYEETYRTRPPLSLVLETLDKLAKP